MNHSKQITKERNAVSADPEIRKVDARTYIPMLRELVREGKTVSVTITGSSMSPFLVHERDQIFFRTPDSKLKIGDIVFYERENGQFVCHRIRKVRKDGTFELIGDNQTDIERGIKEEQIFARVVQVRCKNQIVRPGSFWWEFFEKIWIRMIPLRRPVVTIYSTLFRNS